MFGSSEIIAQKSNPNYNTAIGLRAGGTSGLTIKRFVGNNAIEGIIGFAPNAFSITGLYEIHAAAFNEPGFKWYYGGGAHVAFTGNNYYWRDNSRYYRNTGVGLGIDGIIGLEYKINPIPIAISLDLKPFVEMNTNGGIYSFIDPGLGIKVAF